MQILYIALRNLSRQKKRSFLIAGAISFGTMIIFLLSSLAGGLLENTAQNFASLFQGHIFINEYHLEKDGGEYANIQSEQRIKKIIENAGISSVRYTRITGINGELLYQGRRVFQEVSGVEPEMIDSVQKRLNIRSGRARDIFRDGGRGMILEESLAHSLKVNLHDKIMVRFRTSRGQFNAGEFTVAAFYKSNSILGSSKAYVNFSYLTALDGRGEGEYQRLGLYLSDVKQMKEDGKKIKEAFRAAHLPLYKKEKSFSFGGAGTGKHLKKGETVLFEVNTLYDLLPQIKAIAEALKSFSRVLLVVLFLIIMVGITNTFRIIVKERTKELGTMRALGMYRHQIFLLILFEAGFLSLFGILTGLLTGGILMKLISLIPIGVDRLWSVFLLNGSISFKVTVKDLLGENLVIFLLTVSASLFPARRAGRMTVVKALRS